MLWRQSFPDVYSELNEFSTAIIELQKFRDKVQSQVNRLMDRMVFGAVSVEDETEDDDATDDEGDRRLAGRGVTRGANPRNTGGRTRRAGGL